MSVILNAFANDNIGLACLIFSNFEEGLKPTFLSIEPCFFKKELFFFKTHDFQILWQCGELYFNKYKTLSCPEVVIKSFVYEMEKLYAAADIIISRAGAGSLSELSCVGKPLILIPSPNVTANHQFHNARVLVDKKAAFLVEECDSILESRNLKFYSKKETRL